MADLILPTQRLKVSVAATIDPVTVLEAKQYARIESEDDDSDITRLISSATNYIQDLTGRQFINATFIQYWDRFPNFGEQRAIYGENASYIQLRRLPVSSISQITYVDNDGDTTVWTSSLYQTSLGDPDYPARIKPAFGQSWPTVREQFDSVQCTFVAGYGAAASSVPADAKYAITLLVKHWYDEREPVGSASLISHSLESLIQKLRWDQP